MLAFLLPDFLSKGKPSIHHRKNLFLKSLMVLAITGATCFAGFLLVLTTCSTWALVLLGQS